jgi:hypothetical protein
MPTRRCCGLCILPRDAHYVPSERAQKQADTRRACPREPSENWPGESLERLNESTSAPPAKRSGGSGNPTTSAEYRPCGECRRARFKQFKAAWLAGNPQAASGANPGITMIDGMLHEERLTAEGTKRTYQATVKDLPDGTFVRGAAADDAFLLWRGRLHHWTPGGYDEVHPAEPDLDVDVITPRSIVNALRAGYEPELHRTVR